MGFGGILGSGWAPGLDGVAGGPPLRQHTFEMGRRRSSKEPRPECAKPCWSKPPSSQGRQTWGLPGLDSSGPDLSFLQSGKKRAHKHRLFCPGGLGTTPGLSLGFPGTNPVKTWDKSGEARFHRACPWDKPGLSLGQSPGRRAVQKVYVKKVYVPLSLAIQGF